jgi:hypothetical protein
VQHASYCTCTALFKIGFACFATAAPQAEVIITNSGSFEQTGSLVTVNVTGGISSVQSCSASETAAAGAPEFPEGVQWQQQISMVDAEGLELLSQPPVSFDLLGCSCRNKQLPVVLCMLLLPAHNMQFSCVPTCMMHAQSTTLLLLHHSVVLFV